MKEISKVFTKISKANFWGNTWMGDQEKKHQTTMNLSCPTENTRHIKNSVIRGTFKTLG